MTGRKAKQQQLSTPTLSADGTNIHHHHLQRPPKSVFLQLLPDSLPPQFLYTAIYQDNNSKKCPPIEIISQHDTFANHFLHVLYFFKEGSTERHDSTGFVARLWSCNKFLTKSYIQCATRYLTCRIHVILDNAETIFGRLRIYLGKYIVLCDLVSSGLIWEITRMI